MARDNSKWMPLDRVTVIDVLETGACFEGVARWVMRHKRQIAGDPATVTDSDGYIERAAQRDGNGYGNGYGYGYGDGDGNGYGYGYGNGYGDGQSI